ncbi:MAG: Phosphate transport system permease protein PstA [uncultured Thermomicrobiales bacterium]|uniref:Phosphate transport system permease protein PstA n=1 Tax=uncultured Thermomicrobiales bacterium TaxID=1645740 RepID=A0A6J4VE42_9BACT|nr:MAG: Phosphate transport system permease protein PstA [uncultured Thermomicrobiales bacterium]
MQGQITVGGGRPTGAPRVQPTLQARSGRLRARKLANLLMTGLIGLSALVAVGILFIILGYIIYRGAPSLNLAFFTEDPRPEGVAGGGVRPAIVGSLAVIGLGGLIGIPIGVGTGIYLAEFGRGRFASIVRFVADLLTGLPSIAIGAFVAAILVRRVFGSFNAFAGGFALAIIMIPIIARTVEEILKLVPNTLREASLALGTPQWKTIVSVVLPVARSGILTGIVLSLARAGGETAPLLLTILGNQFLSWDLRGPIAALPLQIYRYAASPSADFNNKAWTASLVLIIVIALLSLTVRLAARQAQRAGR